MDWMSFNNPQGLVEEWNAILDRARPGARAIFRSAGLKVDYLDHLQVQYRQQPTELAAVSGALGLSKAMQDFLEEADQGQGILKADRQRIGFRLEAAPFEFDMAQTG